MTFRFLFCKFKSNIIMAKLQYKTRFNDSWLDEDVFKAWKEIVPDDNYKFYCH